MKSKDHLRTALFIALISWAAGLMYWATRGKGVLGSLILACAGAAAAGGIYLYMALKGPKA